MSSLDGMTQYCSACVEMQNEGGTALAHTCGQQTKDAPHAALPAEVEHAKRQARLDALRWVRDEATCCDYEKCAANIKVADEIARLEQ